jgi:hypothetical protein
LRFCEKNYYNKLLDEKRNNVKETWKILNSVIKRNGSASVSQEKFLNNENKIISDKKDIVNEFNEFFVNVGPDLAKKI